MFQQKEFVMALPIRWRLLFLSSILFSSFVFATGQKAPVFPKKKITINKIVLEVEVAETAEQQSYGLMNRTSLAEGQGMMFVFSNSEIRSFWMKNTFIDLSIGYFDKDKVLFQVLDMKATTLLQKNFPSYVSRSPAQFALEVPKGWFNKHGVKIGDKFNWR